LQATPESPARSPLRPGPRATLRPASRGEQQRLLHSQPGIGALLAAALDPLVAIGTLAAVTAALGARFDGACLILALLVFAMTFPGSFAREGAGPAELALEVITGWLAVLGLLALLGWASHTFAAFDARVLAVWAFATPAALFAAHHALPRVLPRLLSAQGMEKRVVIAGANELGRRLASQIAAMPLLGQRVVGFFDDRSPDRLHDVANNLGGISSLPDYVRAQGVEIIYIALPMASQPRILHLLEDLRDTTASIYFVPDIFVFDLIQARVDSIGDLPVVAVCETPFYGFNGLLKRCSDIVLAAAILMLISPLLLAIALGVKLSSPGPVLFKQRRYGLDGRRIVVYKFRSMTVAEDGDTVRQATKNDARVTRFGAFLRKTSLDELPQFINVLQGRMSVVGPRPHAVAHNEMYRKLIRGYMIRHKVRPGITGLAQVNGYRGETETVDKMKARIEYDLMYLRNWSLLLDLQVILKTFVVVLKKQNAY
jgi:putative colanic acid biosynthesis UDP-glucose lipid carrier transferase